MSRVWSSLLSLPWPIDFENPDHSPRRMARTDCPKMECWTKEHNDGCSTLYSLSMVDYEALTSVGIRQFLAEHSYNDSLEEQSDRSSQHASLCIGLFTFCLLYHEAVTECYCLMACRLCLCLCVCSPTLFRRILVGLDKHPTSSYPL